MPFKNGALGDHYDHFSLVWFSNRPMRVSQFLFLAIFLSGCAVVTHAYPGSKQPEEKIAVIEDSIVALWGYAGGAFVTSIDGQKVSTGFFSNALGFLPGEHFLTVSYSATFEAYRCAWFNANLEAGSTYTIEYRNGKFRLKEKESDKVIAETHKTITTSFSELMKGADVHKRCRIPAPKSKPAV